MLAGQTPRLTVRGTEEGGSGGVVARAGKVKGGMFDGRPTVNYLSLTKIKTAFDFRRRD